MICHAASVQWFPCRYVFPQICHGLVFILYWHLRRKLVLDSSPLEPPVLELGADSVSLANLKCYSPRISYLFISERPSKQENCAEIRDGSDTEVSRWRLARAPFGHWSEWRGAVGSLAVPPSPHALCCCMSILSALQTHTSSYKWGSVPVKTKAMGFAGGVFRLVLMSYFLE